jgi:hypothetical protein
MLLKNLILIALLFPVVAFFAGLICLATLVFLLRANRDEQILKYYRKTTGN